MSCNSQPCNAGLPNLGFGCTPAIKRARRFWFQSTYDDTGTLNSIPYTAELNQAYFTALVNHVGPASRMFPSPELVNPHTSRAEPKYWESDTGAKYFLQQGTRSIEATITESGGNSPQMQGKLDSMRDVSGLSFWIETTDNQFVGVELSDGSGMRGIRVDPQSITAIFNFLEDATVQNNSLKFDWNYVERDASLRQFNCNELGDADLSLELALLEVVEAVFSDKDYTGFTVELQTEWGTPVNPVLATGFSGSYFFSPDSDTAQKAYNETTEADVSLVVAPSTVTPGIYAVTFPAQAYGDVLTFYVKRPGYAKSEVFSVTIPTT
jgi:hypothetical protein